MFRRAFPCAVALAAVLTIPSAARAEERAAFHGTHGYLGVTAGGGGGAGMAGGGGGGFGVFVGSVRGGLEIGRFQLDLDVVPLSSMYALSRVSPAIQVMAGPGVLIPLSGRWSWPIRVQAGVGAFTDGGKALFVGRADLVGVEHRIPLSGGFLSLEGDLGSRVLYDGSTFFLAWEGRVGVAYVF